MIGMLLGILFGILMIRINGGNTFIANWIKPIGTIFVNLLKLIAIPLILASLIKGVSDLKDISQLSKMGLRTLSIYILTTLIAICIGLTLVNIAQPGAGLSTETIASLSSEYAGNENVQSKLEEANKQMNSGPLKFLVDIVPQNAFSALSDNSLMLQVIFIALFIGVCLLLVPETKAKPLKDLFDSLNEVVLKMVDVIMLLAPFAVFALLADVVASSADPAVLLVLLKYALVVLAGLLIIIAFYLLSIAVLVRKSPFWFLKELSPALLTAFSTSSSAATLPVTMERVEEHLGVDGEVASFVLPLGATI
jgi:Na+/H+-dicarboxylate symporter